MARDWPERPRRYSTRSMASSKSAVEAFSPLGELNDTENKNCLHLVPLLIAWASCSPLICAISCDRSTFASFPPAPSGILVISPFNDLPAHVVSSADWRHQDRHRTHGHLRHRRKPQPKGHQGQRCRNGRTQHSTQRFPWRLELHYPPKNTTTIVTPLFHVRS